ncbi:MAG: hypothetical protein ACI9Y1_001722 [Lentisphaeria bacterium]|jgi:hypothetical protein
MSKGETVAQKYLLHYAENEVKLLAPHYAKFPKRLSHCLVIPAFNETVEFVNRLTRHQDSNNTLLVLVINRPDTTMERVKKSEAECEVTSKEKRHTKVCANTLLFEAIATSSICIFNTENLSLQLYQGLAILLVDRFSKTLEIPKKQGVGLARKIGCDIICALSVNGALNTRWIHSSDADAFIPENYFRDSNLLGNESAQVFDFTHTNDNSATALATQRYQEALKYYRLALEWAGSPYAFYTLGSTLAVNVFDYCRCRGFPRRAGGEDFYLLNKLAKLGAVVFNAKVTIVLQARLSCRVPFGTGPAVEKILALEDSDQHYVYYNPEIFVQLKSLLSFSHRQIAPMIEQRFTEEQIANTINCKLSSQNQHALSQLDFTSFIRHALRQCKVRTVFNKHFYDWFDAFTTLKYIHYLQVNHYPAIPLNDCIQGLSRLSRESSRKKQANQPQ